MTIKSYLKTAEKFTIDNSPTILTSIGVVGTVSTAVLTAQSTIKACQILVGDPDFRDKELTTKQIIGKTWQCYIPPVVVGGITVTSIIMANQIGSKRAAAVAAAYTISERAFDDYREKVVEKIGETKEQAVRDEVATDRVRKDAGSTVVISSNKVLCYDTYSGRYFESTMEDLKKAQNDLNYRVLSDGYGSLNDYYDLLWLAGTSVGEEMGWRAEQILDVEYSTVLSDDQRPCIAITFRVQPVRNYYRF